MRRNSKQINEIISKSSKVRCDDYFGRKYPTMCIKHVLLTIFNNKRHVLYDYDEEELLQRQKKPHTHAHRTDIHTQNGAMLMVKMCL